MTMVCRGGVLLSLLVVLLTRSQVSGGQGCEWDSTSEHGLNPRSLDAGARHLAFLPNIKDAVGCQRACCEHPECQIAMIGTPADDGTPECFLVGCMSEGKNVCELQSDTQFNAYIKKANVQPEKIHISLLVEDKSNNTGNVRPSRRAYSILLHSILFYSVRLHSFYYILPYTSFYSILLYSFYSIRITQHHLVYTTLSFDNQAK